MLLVSRFSLAFVLAGLLWSPGVAAAVTDLSVSDLQLVNSQRVGRTVYRYTYTITVSNSGGPLENVVATVASQNRNTVIVENSIALGDIETGDTQSTDTFTFNHNRRYVFDPDNLVFSFTADEPASNSPPTADAGPDQSVDADDTVTLNGTNSSDPDGDTLSYLWTLTRPAGSNATLSSNSSPSPSFVADVPGAYSATLVVNDGTDSSPSDEVLINAAFAGDSPPAIVSTPTTQGSVGEAYSYDVNAVDPDVGDTLTYALQLNPAGMTIDASSGLITWLPDEPGPADVDVIVTDSTGLTDRQIYLISVNNGSGDLPPTLAPIANQSTVINTSIILTAMGSDPEGEAVRYGMSAAPAGLVINTATGQLVWTPSAGQIGTFSATVTATDPGGQQASQSFEILVLQEDINNPPEIDPVSDQTVNALNSIQLSFSASDPDEFDILTFSLAGGPSAVQFDPANATLFWTPGTDDAGVTSFIATVTDSAGSSDSVDFSITVAEPPFPPTAVNDAYTIDRDAVLRVPADGVLANDTDPNNDVLTALDTSAPTLGTLDLFTGNGSFEYTPPANPDIEVGLRFRCSSRDMPLNKNHIGATALVADWDHDGTTEMIGMAAFGGFNFQIYIMDGSDCSLKQPVITLPSTTHGVFPQLTPGALANLDDDPDLELIMVRTGPPELGINRARIMAINLEDGSFVWSLPQGVSEQISLQASFSQINYYQSRGPTIADLDGDGEIEILMPLIFDPGVFNFVGGIVVYNADGTIKWEFQGVEQTGDSDRKPLLVADLDLDGTLEVIYHTNVVDHNGNLEFNLQTDRGSNFNPTHATVAVANFDNDPFPELLVRDHVNIYLFEHTSGAPTWTVPNIEWSASTSELTVGDFDGDGMPEFAFHGGTGTGIDQSFITAFDTDGSVMWTHDDTTYMSAATENDNGLNLVSFDFDQDGKDEITAYLRTRLEGSGIFIFNGDDGAERARLDEINGSPTFIVGGHSIFPTIVDVDYDGAAEILYPISSGLGFGPMVIAEGLAGNPFPAARPIRNQHINQPTHINLDGSIPAYPAPQWLIPGMNKHNGAAVVPDEDPGANDSFTYKANDGTADSNEATVAITISNVNAPTIISNPPLGGSPDFDYVYGLLATDGDFGEVFTWTLVDAPAGMAISNLGVVSWLPDETDLGSHRVHIVVTDQQGNSDEQSFGIDVVPPVVVPNLLGSPEGDASAAIVAAGLAVGSVTQGFSFTVPAGEVISQSIVGGATSPAGAFVNIVISLGPQPILVPELSALSQSSAQALLESIGLALGTVTLANDNTAPVGSIIGQSIVAQTQVEFESSVDITLSSGPAVVIGINSAMITAGTNVPLSVTVFDSAGVALDPQPSITLSIAAGEGALGTLPLPTLTEIATASDTVGPYTLEVDAGAFGLVTEPLIVRGNLATDEYYKPIAEFADTVVDAQQTFGALVTALQNNDLIAIQALGQQLVELRDAIDLEELEQRNAFAPEDGFLPTLQQAVAAGFPAGFGELGDGGRFFATLESAIEQQISFLELLNPNVGRDDDVRARALNDAFSARIDEFFGINFSVGAEINFNEESYVLISQLLPRLLRADLTAMIGVLQDNNLLAMQADNEFMPIAALAPDVFYADTQPSFFSLGGLMTASAIRTGLIKDLYVPHITRLVSAALVLAEAQALIMEHDTLSISGAITGASLSFHVFKRQNSVLEAVGLGRDVRGYKTTVVGPDAFQPVFDAIANATKPRNFLQFLQLAATIKAAAEAGNATRQTAQAHDILRGCVLEVANNCSQLVYGEGFPIVHSSGSFPAPVLLVVEDTAAGRFYVGVFPFLPN